MSLPLLHAVIAQNLAYIHGDVAADGTIPSGGNPFHQMLLTDTGDRGCSNFKALVEAEGYTINQYYDQATTLDTAFLEQFDAIIFGLHQKVWSAPEKLALDAWIRAGGGILMYSDSAAGGLFSSPNVGIDNDTGQTAVNSILSDYGMEVTVDLGGGTRAYESEDGACNPTVWDQPEFEGEGVSPVAVDEGSGAEVLIPFEESSKVSGGGITIDIENITISNPRWAALALNRVGDGSVMAIFDRQPMWNNGEGSDIDRLDNREILRRVVKWLVRDYGNSPSWFEPRSELKLNPGDGKTYLELTYRQWSGGSGTAGVDYVARNTRFVAEYSPNLGDGSWTSGAAVGEPVGSVMDRGDETEDVTVRVLPADLGTPRGFARLSMTCVGDLPMADAGGDRIIGQSGTALLDGSVSGSGVTGILWSKASGPGTVTFGSQNSASTTATFSTAGDYELRLEVNGGSVFDMMQVRVVAAADIERAVNCGGGAFAGTHGFTYEADGFFTGGHVDRFLGNAVAGTLDDALYNTARSKHSAYTIPVANGDYTVLLQFAETFFTGSNSRVFDASIEGQLVIDDLDLVATAPGKWVAYDRAFQVTVSDGQLNLGFSSSINNSLLNAIVVIRD